LKVSARKGWSLAKPTVEIAPMKGGREGGREGREAGMEGCVSEERLTLGETRS